MEETLQRFGPEPGGRGYRLDFSARPTNGSAIRSCADLRTDRTFPVTSSTHVETLFRCARKGATGASGVHFPKGNSMSKSALTRLLGAAAVTLAVSAAFAQPASASGGDDDRHGSPSSNQVFEATNAAAGNAVQVFDQAGDGTLTVGPVVRDRRSRHRRFARIARWDRPRWPHAAGRQRWRQHRVIVRHHPARSQSPRRRAVWWRTSRQRDSARRCRLRAQRR